MEREAEQFSPPPKRRKRSLHRVLFRVKCDSPNELFEMILSKFYAPPTTPSEGQEFLDCICDLLTNKPDLVNSVDTSDVFQQQNTVAHYLAFFLGSYAKHDPVACDTFSELLGRLVLDFGCDLTLPNAKGATVLSFAKNKKISGVIMDIIRAKIDDEKRKARAFLEKPDPVFERCGLIRDMQREIKLTSLMDRVKTVYKLIALREIRQCRSFCAQHILALISAWGRK